MNGYFYIDGNICKLSLIVLFFLSFFSKKKFGLQFKEKSQSILKLKLSLNRSMKENFEIENVFNIIFPIRSYRGIDRKAIIIF